MNKDKIEGFLIGIGAGILVTAFLQAGEQLRKSPEKTVTAPALSARFGHAVAPAEPSN
jgi:hypothetical protein